MLKENVSVASRTETLEWRVFPLLGNRIIVRGESMYIKTKVRSNQDGFQMLTQLVLAFVLVLLLVLVCRRARARVCV